MSDWYAVHVKARFEEYVTKQLSTKGYETFLPMYADRRNWSDRIKTVSLPLFPNYVFCRFNVHARLPIIITPGVMAIVGSGKRPASIDDSEVASIRLVTNSGTAIQPWPYLALGERVQVQTGPLKGLIAIVDRTKGNRVVVSLNLLMRSISVEIDRNSVKPLQESQPGFVRPLEEGGELVPMLADRIR